MNDPHVVRLHYLVRLPELVSFKDPALVTWTTPEGDLTLDADHASIELVNHYATEDDARIALQPYLEAWEIWAGLTSSYDRRLLSFEFRKAEIVDRAPPPGQVAALRARGVGTVTASAVVSVSFPEYPAPPQSFTASDEVQRIWHRWEQYRSDRETLPSVAFYCLTALEHSVGGTSRKARIPAGVKFSIDPAVLNELGNLVSNVGSDEEARKAHRPDPRDYTGAERRWMEAVVKAIIKRVGEVAANPTGQFPLIDMSSLPTK